MKKQPNKNRLDDYRLSRDEYLGFKWQDKRDGQDTVYSRYFTTAAALRDFLKDYFGLRVMRRVFDCNGDILANGKLLPDANRYPDDVGSTN